MQAILLVRYTVYNNDAEQNTEIYKESWKELRKDFDIDFAPVEGMRLMFSPITNSNERAVAYKRLLEQSSTLTTGIFAVESISYHVAQKCFYIDAVESVESVEILDAVT